MNNKKNWKNWLKVFSLAIFVLFLANCGGGGGSESGSSNNSSSSQKIDAMTVTMNDAAKIYKNSGIDPNVAADKTVEWLKNQSGVIDASLDIDGNNIIVKDITGITTVIILNDDYLNSNNTSAKPSNLKALYKTLSANATSNTKAIILKPFDVLSLNPSKVNDTLVNNGAAVTYLKNENVTVHSIANLNDYDIIYYFGHGAISNKKTIIDKRDVTPIAISSGELFTKDKIEAYSKELENLGVPLIKDSDGGNQYLYRFTKASTGIGTIDNAFSTIGVTSKFIEAYNKNIKATVVYIDACHSLESEAMADAFIQNGNGAKTYLGWNKSVSGGLISSTYLYPQSIFTDLYAGFNVETAYNKLTFDSSNALLLARGDSKAKLPPFIDTTPSAYSISGRVTLNGTGLPGVTVSTNGGSGTTDANGYYTISGLPNGSYTLTPAKTGYAFTPASQSVTVSRANVTNQDFSASVPLVTYSMSGTIHSVSNSGPALSGATVSIAGKTATTSSTGVFSIADIPAGTYAFSVSNSGYDTYTNPAYYVGSNQTSLSFYLTQPTQLNVPTISSPTANAVLTNFPRTAYLTWSNIAGATSYDIELDISYTVSASTYSNTATYSSTSSSYTTPQLVGDNPFRFRVRAKNSSTTGVWSSYSYFSYNTTPSTQLGTPAISSPMANAVLTNYPRIAYLSWSNVSGATSYEIEFYFSSTMPGAPTNYEYVTTWYSSTNSFTTPVLSGDNPMGIRVRAKNNSSTGPWSSYRYFSYKTPLY